MPQRCYTVPTDAGLTRDKHDRDPTASIRPSAEHSGDREGAQLRRRAGDLSENLRSRAYAGAALQRLRRCHKERMLHLAG